MVTNFPLQFKTYSPDFTQIEIWFRCIFLLFTFIVIVSFCQLISQVMWL